MPRYRISEEKLDEFRQNGVVVIPSVISEKKVNQTLIDLDKYLSFVGVDSSDLQNTGNNLTKLSSTNGSGGVLDVYYEPWKLSLNEDEQVVCTLQDLWHYTYASGTQENFTHPFGAFDASKGYMYVDRICYRVSSAISELHGKSKRKQLQRSLTPHLDCCPHDMYGSKGTKWRPIQAFIALTDTLEPDHGGFEACPGHHIGFDEWAAKRKGSAAPTGTGTPSSAPPCLGDFSPIRMIEDRDVIDKFRHIPCKAGDLVCWVRIVLQYIT